MADGPSKIWNAQRRDSAQGDSPHGFVNGTGPTHLAAIKDQLLRAPRRQCRRVVQSWSCCPVARFGSRQRQVRVERSRFRLQAGLLTAILDRGSQERGCFGARRESNPNDPRQTTALEIADRAQLELKPVQTFGFERIDHAFSQ